MASRPPEGGFVWGAGGRRLTPEQIEFERRIASGMMQSDYSPVQSPWQGLARVAENLTGALRDKRAIGAQDANAAESSAVLNALMGGGGGDTAAAAMTNQYVSPDVRDFAGKVWERANPKPGGPTEMQRNYEWLSGMNPTAAENFLNVKTTAPPVVARNPDGTMTLYPEGSIPRTAPSPAPAADPATILQGASQSGLVSPEEAATVRSSMGPNGQAQFDAWMQTNGISVGKRLSNGQAAYFVNGKWYDNPEGR